MDKFVVNILYLDYSVVIGISSMVLSILYR